MNCRYCGQLCEASESKCAHIVPIEMGGPSEEANCILLCPGCHGAYDGGAVSINRMREVAALWGNGERPSREQLPAVTPLPNPEMVDPPERVRSTFDDTHRYRAKRHYLLAAKLVKHRLADAELDDIDRICLSIKYAELTRRRAGKGVVEQALCYLNRINPEAVPEKYKPVFHYELGYVHRLLGRHGAAARFMALSAEFSRGHTVVGYVAASANEILCRIAEAKSLTPEQGHELVLELDALRGIAASEGGYRGCRWAMNCAAHALQVRIKAGDEYGGRDAMKQLLVTAFGSDVHQGWDSGALPTIALLMGLVYAVLPASDDDLNTGIALLARSFISRSDHPRQRPEGVRDAGIGLALALGKRGDPATTETAVLLHQLMQQTVDGTSVLWPSRET